MSSRPPVPLSDDTSMSVVCFGDSLKTGAMTLGEFLDTAVDLGFRAVELCDRSIFDVAQVQAELAARGLAMPSIAVRNDFTGSSQDVTESVAHVKRWLPIAKSFASGMVRAWTGWLRNDVAARRQIESAFDEVVAEAMRVGVAIAVETHGGPSNDPEFMARLCRRYPPGALGVCLDFGNLPGPRRWPLIQDFTPIATHVHVKSYEFDAGGRETTVPLEEALAGLRDNGYTGQWVIEYEGPPPHERGIALTTDALQRSLGRPRYLPE